MLKRCARQKGSSLRLLHVYAINKRHCVVRLRRADFQQLVAADAQTALGNRTHALGIERDIAGAHVDNDKIIAETMHFNKGNLVHKAVYRAARVYRSIIFTAQKTKRETIRKACEIRGGGVLVAGRRESARFSRQNSASYQPVVRESYLGRR